MPILDIRIVSADPGLPADVAQRLADAVGRTLGCAPGRAWVRIEPVDAAHYAENESPMDTGGLPVFATVLHADPPQGAVRHWIHLQTGQLLYPFRHRGRA